MKNNILHVFASTTWGGGEQYIFDLAKKQIESGYRITLVAGDSEVIRNKVKELNCSYTVLKNRWHLNPFSIYRMRQIILREKVDIVHIHQFRDAFIAVLATFFIVKNRRPKVIITRHLVKKGKSSPLYRWLYGKLHKLIFVSELAKKEFLIGVQIPETKIAVIHNSIAPKVGIAKKINFRKNYKLEDNSVLIGFVGRIVKFKGVELLLEIAEKINDRNVAFFLAGCGEKKYEAYLRALIAEKKLEQRFFLVGFFNNPEEFIAEMNIGVLPSLCIESFGLSTLEFMRAGIPVITSNTGAQVEFVEHKKTGFLVNPTVEEVTKALLKLLDNREFMEEIGSNARLSYAKQFNYDDFFTKIMIVYSEH